MYLMPTFVALLKVLRNNNFSDSVLSLYDDTKARVEQPNTAHGVLFCDFHNFCVNLSTNKKIFQ